MAELITTSGMAKTVATYLSDSVKESKALKSFFTDFTDATVKWLRPIFLIDDKEEKEMIKDLIEKPDDTDNLQEIETAIIKAVKKQPELETTLAELVKEIQAKTGNTVQKTNTINVTGNENQTIQDVNNSSINITGKSTHQHHTGTGDNISGDKKTYNIDKIDKADFS
jgi:phenylalanyl-tRNA synthetase alpha subunit